MNGYRALKGDSPDVWVDYVQKLIDEAMAEIGLIEDRIDALIDADTRASEICCSGYDGKIIGNKAEEE